MKTEPLARNLGRSPARSPRSDSPGWATTALRRALRALPCIACAPLIHAQVLFDHVVVDALGPQEAHTKAVGDLNGDGFPDLVVAGTVGQLYWYEDRSAGPAWTRHVIVESGKGAWSTDAECGDVDGDGDEDLVISDWNLSQRVVWFENLGSGTSFQIHVIGGPAAHDIEASDLDLDGDLDLATRQQSGQGNSIELWRNEGGSWTHLSLPLAGPGEGLTVGDVDLDGDPDMVAGRTWYENRGAILDADAWVPYEYAPTWGNEATRVVLGDLDGNGRPDIVVTPSEAQGGAGRTEWYAAPPDPRAIPWTSHIIEACETVVHSLAAGDIDLDGDLDVLTGEMHQGTNPDEIRVYLNGGDGMAWIKQVVATSGSHSMRLVDVGADGDLDLFGVNWTGTTQVDLWENKTQVSRPRARRFQ